MKEIGEVFVRINEENIDQKKNDLLNGRNEETTREGRKSEQKKKIRYCARKWKCLSICHHLFAKKPRKFVFLNIYSI